MSFDRLSMLHNPDKKQKCYGGGGGGSGDCCEITFIIGVHVICLNG